MASATHYSVEHENLNFVFKSELRKRLIMAMAIGVILILLGCILLMMGIGVADAHHGAGHGTGHHGGGGAEGSGHGFHWTKRLWANLWLNGVFFTGIAVIGVFFVAVQYVAHAGWSSAIKRIPEAFGYFLPITGGLLLILFFIAGHDLFHWTHSSLYEKGGKEFDKILYGKSGFFFFPLKPGSFPFFYVLRMIIFFGGWYFLFMQIRKLSLKEDLETDFNTYLKRPVIYNKLVYISTVFVVFFAISSSVSAWDWIMSIDSHWFSTMFGWYVFSSWHVTGLATIALAVILLKEQGYLKVVNENHLHDLGKFMFAFSIFWTYIWFSQFLLIYYANIPEEAIYFKERLSGHGGLYAPVFFLNIFFNFFFPFLILMTRASKRNVSILKIAIGFILVGHYLDFFMMVMPGTVGANGGFGLIEAGCLLLFASAFIYVVASNLAKAPLIAKNHPFIKESEYHVVL
ncbi:MAG: quinol:cytochrome C oxidoreductase [Microscillaceae bacterium]|nr:quinol:cytochrome C oxidoreductase [Microscillaceae bacterium]MDW8461724.1 quinol:cytochrome C oxidoreductase [Cytophagales bacterium]